MSDKEKSLDDLLTIREYFMVAAQELNAANDRIKQLEFVVNDPEALWSNWLRGTVALPSGIGDVRQYQEHIKRLEEAGEHLWVKARNISIEDTYDRHGDEATVHELNPETVVLEYEHGDGITAGNMVELLEALREWKKAKEAKP